MDNPNTFVVDDFTALTLGILVYFIGANLTQRFRILREWSIPEPVSGGLLAALIALAVVAFTGKEIQYQLDARDVLGAGEVAHAVGAVFLVAGEQNPDILWTHFAQYGQGRGDGSFGIGAAQAV